MYTRVPSGRMPRGMRVPENYAGNAFRPLPHEPPYEKRAPIVPHAPLDDVPPPPEPTAPLAREEEAVQEPPQRDLPPEADLPPEPHPDADPPDAPVGAKPSSLGFKLPFRLPSFGTGLSIGFEELLLLGIILLISQEGKNDDLILLLILLLFIH